MAKTDIADIDRLMPLTLSGKQVGNGAGKAGVDQELQGLPHAASVGANVSRESSSLAKAMQARMSSAVRSYCCCRRSKPVAAGEVAENHCDGRARATDRGIAVADIRVDDNSILRGGSGHRRIVLKRATKSPESFDSGLWSNDL